MPGVVETGVATVRVESPGTLAVIDTAVELRDATGPMRETEAVRDTAPAKPFTLVTLMVELPDWPAGKVRGVGLAETTKSPTVTVTLMSRDRSGPVP